MSKKNTKDCTDCTGVNIGLIFAIVILLIITICIGCCYEGFSNIFPKYTIPSVNQPVPSLQRLTVPVYEEIAIVDKDSMEKIEEAQAVIQNETDKILARREYLRSTRINAPAPRPIVRPTPAVARPQPRPQAKAGSAR